MLKIDLLNSFHNRKEFDCGNIHLNDYLKKTARQHLVKGISRTFVLVDDADCEEILGFFTLSVCEVESELLPLSIAKKYPKSVPAVKLARLAVSLKNQNCGLGKYLISSAVEKVISISEIVGVIGLFVDAKDENAIGYYESYGFISLNGSPFTLFLPIQTLIESWNA